MAAAGPTNDAVWCCLSLLGRMANGEESPQPLWGGATFNKEILPFQTVETFKNKRCAIFPALFSIHEASLLVVRQDENNTQ